MSNENNTVNRPKRFNSSGRYRKFSCITYLSELQLKVGLMAHSNQIRVYAYAVHDKDVDEEGKLKQSHIHLILVTHCTCSLSAIRRWFAGFLDNGKEITTTAQAVTDVYQVYDYLTHKHNPEKYQYDSSIIHCNDFGYFRADERSSYDNLTLASEMLLTGSSVRELGRTFGRDFILHYNSIKSYVNDVLRFQKYGMSLEDVLEREYEMEIDRLNNGGF